MQNKANNINNEEYLGIKSSALHAEGHRFESCSAHHFLASISHFMSHFKSSDFLKWCQTGVRVFLYCTSFISISMLLFFGYCFAVSPMCNFKWTFYSNIYNEGWFEFIVCPISAITTTILIIVTITNPNWLRKVK